MKRNTETLISGSVCHDKPMFYAKLLLCNDAFSFHKWIIYISQNIFWKRSIPREGVTSSSWNLFYSQHQASQNSVTHVRDVIHWRHSIPGSAPCPLSKRLLRRLNCLWRHIPVKGNTWHVERLKNNSQFIVICNGVNWKHYNIVTCFATEDAFRNVNWFI